MKLIDTDVLIDHFHGHRAALEYLAQQMTLGEQLSVSIVTVTELLEGMRPGEEEKTERLLYLFTVLDADEEIARNAAAYLRQYRRTHKLELGDALIAATAKLHHTEVVTRNIKHYPMDDIAVVVPYERGR